VIVVTPAPQPVPQPVPQPTPTNRTASEVKRQLQDARDAYAQALAVWDALMARTDPAPSSEEQAEQRQAVALAKARVEALERVISRSGDDQ